jgi:hypothetical protein
MYIATGRGHLPTVRDRALGNVAVTRGEIGSVKILPYYDYNQFAKIVGRSRRTVDTWAARGRIPGLGGGRITLAGLKAHLEMETDQLRELDIDFDDPQGSSVMTA